MRDFTLMEVCPRDGWQNVARYIPADLKITYIKDMLNAGVRAMQITSFVHPKSVPQMRDAQQVASEVLPLYPHCWFDALVPNLQGARTAAESGLVNISYVVSVSATHNQKNINRTHDESFSELENICSALPNMSVSLALSTAFGCPFEGQVSLDKVLELAERGVALGVTGLELADTIGVAHPSQVRQAFQQLRRSYPQIRLSAHMHDTRNNGILNSWTALEAGADVAHTALGGLGGCPFAPGASGNTATEDLAWLLEREGHSTGLGMPALISLARRMSGDIQGAYSSHQMRINSQGPWACQG